MKILILISLFAYTLAEAPIEDSYSSALSNNDDIDIQKSLSFEYGVPELSSRSSPVYGPPTRSSAQEYENLSRSGAFQKHGQARTISREYGTPTGRSSLSQEYGTPNTRTSLSQVYGAPSARNSPSQVYGAPSARNSPSQVYGAPSTRNSPSQVYGVPSARNSPSQVYGAPSARNSPSELYGTPSSRNALSQVYGTPSSRSSLSTKYGVPNTRNSLSQEYGTPNTRDSLSQEYGLPSSRALSQGAPQFSSTLSDSYGAPRSALSNSYGTPLQRSSSNLYNAPGFEPIPSEEYGVPSRSFDVSQNSLNPISDDYTVPSSRLSDKALAGSSYSSRNTASFGGRSLSTQYGTPNARSSAGSRSSYIPQPSDSYGAPKSLPSEYGTPAVISDLKTNAYAANFNSARSSSSQGYAPSARSGMPSQQYGVPDLYNSISNQGYGYARNALDELFNQEPASYDFGYKVNDYQSGSDFGHTETRQDNKAEGSYFVVLPDGTKQIVEYEADERGFKPKISVEPAETGYDDNAADISRSGDGPY